MYKYKIAEKFVSINGEGRKAGQLAVFIRFKGCNLNCSYCDTLWANAEDCPFELMTANEILIYIQKTGVKNVTVTGGEPLIQDGIKELLELLCNSELNVEVETNGSVSISEYNEMNIRPSFTLDYKTPSSDMEKFMDMKNYEYLTDIDTVKFVCGNYYDLERSKKIIEKYNLSEKCAVYFSCIFDKIEPEKMVEYMIENKMNDVNFQLQLHKFIWNPEQRGV